MAVLILGDKVWFLDGLVLRWVRVGALVHQVGRCQMDYLALICSHVTFTENL